MKIGDYVLIPHKSSKKYSLARIIGEYAFGSKAKHQLWHSRRIEMISEDIPREIFNQSIQYFLGAYRTIFKAKQEEEIIKAIGQYKSKK